MTKMVIIHAGPLWEAQLLQGKLDEEGIASFIPDEMTKRVDPFITGANALSVQLQVRAPDAERAQPFIEEYIAATRTRGSDDPISTDSDDGLDDETRAYLQRQTRLGRRIRWASLLVVTAPIGMILGVPYLAAMRRDLPHPNGHGLNLAAIVIATVLTLLGIAALTGLVT